MDDFYGEYEITCPYCFFKFSHDHTVFRANTGFSQSELDLSDNDDGGLLGNRKQTASSDSRRFFRKFDSEDSFASDKKLDTNLIKFWKERGGSSGYMHVDKHWDYPHIDPTDPNFREMISFTPTAKFVPGEDGFVRDRDGFITRVVDKYSNPIIPMTRLCPDCHNPLPLPDYGKYPVIFISVVGVTGAGKTVYLNQLLTKFADVIAGTGFRVGAHNLDAVGESVCPGSPLPGSTDDKMMRRPLAVSLMNNDPNANPKGLTIVFYDIAGENCVNEQGNPDTARARSTIGHFIASCHGLIFLIDPEQLPPFASGSIVRPSDIGNVVGVMSDVRVNMNPDEPTWDNIPVAVTIAKSDKLRNCASIERDNAIFSYGAPVKGYDRDENMGIHEFLKTFLDANANTVIAPLDTFRRQSYFAVSAITCGVDSRFEKYQNMYILDSENESMFQSLRRWVDGWNKRTPENRKFFMKCPVHRQDGSEISFPTDMSITKQTAAGIVTEIIGYSTHADPLYLDLWDVAAEVNLTGYPVADPSPRRVGDPLKWILWKLGLIGPYYYPIPPRKKGLLESSKRYQDYLNQLDMENYIQSRLFYGEEIENP